MNNKDNILVWVNDANNSTTWNFTKFLSNRLNLSLTGVYINTKNVHYSNTNSFDFDYTLVLNRSISNAIMQNKIKNKHIVYVSYI